MRRRRRVLGLGLVAAAALGVVLLSGGFRGGTARSAAQGSGRPDAGTRSVARPAAAHRVRKHHRRAGPSPGSLPQTMAYPSASSDTFRSLMASLWSGIADNSPEVALPAFFPKAAYVQLKTVFSASSDWSNRLVHNYGLDIGAAHALLGNHARQGQLIAVRAQSGYGHWVPAGVCENDVGYYELPNARVVYREDGQVRSFGIASMISWRGVWYVVHLGAILRSADIGMVDEPSSGPGTSAYSGTC